MNGLRLVSYAADAASPPRGGVVRDGMVWELYGLLGSGAAPRSMLEALDHWDEVHPALSAAVFAPEAGQPLDAVQLHAPILYPRALFCAGANYTDHVAEMAQVLNLPKEEPREGDTPWHFVATPSHSIVGPGATVAVPAYSTKLDWEAEVGVVIGRAARDVSVADAMAHVAGLLIVNDLSCRDHVARPAVPVGSPFHWDWMSQKCFTGAKPMGPWIVPIEDVPDAGHLSVKLWVNGGLMQDSTTANLIFGVAEQIAHLSSRLTLHPGDVIATGTPAGVGLARGVFLQPGDEVRIEVGSVGTLINHIAARS